MKNNITKIIVGTIILAIIIIGMALIQNNDNNTNTNIDNTNTTVTEEITISTTIDSGETTNTYDKKISTDSTALNVLNLIADEDDIILGTSTTDFGVLINSIDSIGEDADDGKYWSFYVNDEMASVGVADYIVSNNDIILMKYQAF
ncbi:MAG: DUF4430 domain-containing protein [Candidatus Kerfeldbacteria bacterium]